MKKKIIIISIVVLILAVGIAIGVKALNKQSTYDALMEMDQKQQVSDLQEKNLTFYFQGEEPNDTRKILDGVQKQAGNLNIKLDFKFIKNNEQGYINDIRTVINSGIPIDAFFYSSNFSNSLSSLVKENLVMDLTSLSKDFAPNYFQSFSKEELRAMSVDDKIYAIPNKTPLSAMKCALVNENLMKKYNIPDIKSYDDFEAYLKNIRANEPDLIPLKYFDTTVGLFAEANGYVILDYQQGLVYKWDDPSLKLMAWEQTPEFKKYINKLKNWYKQGYCNEDNFTAPVDEKAISSGKLASIIITPETQLVYSSILNNDNGVKYKLYKLYPDKTSQRLDPTQYSMLISKNSSNADRVLMFYDWLVQDQSNYDALMYGVKGKNYDLKDNNVIPKGSTNWPWKNPLQDIKLERGINTLNKSSIEEYSKRIETETKYSPTLGFHPDYSTVEDAAQYRNNTYYELDQKISLGLYNDSDLEKYISESKDNGVDKLVAEIQRQLDNWKKQN